MLIHPLMNEKKAPWSSSDAQLVSVLKWTLGPTQL